jgi:pimeloyl-ACP methyl ester carboxylesterase
MASIKEIEFTPAMLAKVKGPVLTIHGRKDRNAPYGGGREWAIKLPDARLVTLPEAAHNALNEFPDVVVPLMREFFSGAWPARAEKVKSLEPA